MKKNGKKNKKPSESNANKKLKKSDDLHQKSLVAKAVINEKCDDDCQDTEYNDSDEEEDSHANKLNNQKPPLSKVGRLVKEMKIKNSGLVPSVGHIFKTGEIRTAGDYYLGPILGSSPVRSMVQCLGRKKDTDEFYSLKILTIRDSSEETQDDKQGKMLLHTEHSLLSFLNGQPGIIKEHGLFEDYACDGMTNNEDKALVANGKVVRRICLVLDCVIPHAFNTESSDYINLQHYVIGKRKLMELDALIIFYNIVSVVKNLHDLNVIHRDLKLANLVLNKRNRQIILTNFCLGQHLVSEDDKLLDQRGSPAYISPDVLIGKPYLGKPSDMWALGVVLFTMLYGQFPFYHKYHQELFKMIKTAQYTVPNDGGVKSDTLEVIQSLLCLDPLKRSTASQILTKLTSVITKRLTPETFASQDAQVVPDLPEFDDDFEVEETKKKRKLSAMEGEEDDVSREKDSCNVLDYLLQRTVPHPDLPMDKKTTLSFNAPGSATRGNMNYCYSTVNKDESTSSSPRSGSTISIIEGDLRTFTQSDLFTHRSIFPHYSGPDLFGGWRNPSSVPPPTASSGTSSPAGRALPRIGTIAGPVRMPSSRLTLPSIHIPTSNNSPNLYEFPPARRWALAVLQQIHNNPNAKPPVVPQLDFHVPDISKASSSGVPSDVPRQSPGVAVDEPKIKGILSNKPQSPKPSCSGVGKKVTFMEDPGRPLERERTEEEPGPSTRCPDAVLNRERPSMWNKSSLALRRIKNRTKTKISNKSCVSLKLQMLNNHVDAILDDNYSNGNSSGSISSSSGSGGDIDSSSSNTNIDNSTTSLIRELITCNDQSNTNAESNPVSELIPSAASTNAQDEIGFLNAVVGNLMPTDDNNNNDEINNNNNDDNNNSENNNLNISNNNNLNDYRDNQLDENEN